MPANQLVNNYSSDTLQQFDSLLDHNLVTSQEPIFHRPLSAYKHSNGEEPLDAPLPWWRKLAYGVGGPPMQLLSNILGFFLVIFLLDTVGLSPFYISIIQFSARGWDAVTDPIIGYLVTKTETRIGKFRPWLILSAPFGIASFFFLFYVPDLARMEYKFLFYLCMVLVLQTSLTCFHVPYSSMTMVLTTNVRERDTCSAIRMGFELLGVLLGIGVFGAIVNHHTSKLECNSTELLMNNVTLTARHREKLGYVYASGATCIIFAFCALVVFFGSKERKIPVESKENYLKSLKKILGFKPYLLLMFAFMFISLGLQMVQGNLAVFIQTTLKMKPHFVWGVLVAMVTAIASIPLIQFLILRFGKKIAFASGLIALSPVQVAIMFIPPQVHLAVYYLIMIVAGYTIGVGFLLPWSMLPDVIDAFTLKYRVRKEAAFYSFYVFFCKFAVGITLAISVLVLGAFGYDSSLCEQPPAMHMALRSMMGPFSMFCFVLSGICLYLYPITEEYRLEVKDKIHQRLLERELMEKSCATIVTSINVITEIERQNMTETAQYPITNDSPESGYLVMHAGNGSVTNGYNKTIL